MKKVKIENIQVGEILYIVHVNYLSSEPIVQLKRVEVFDDSVALPAIGCFITKYPKHYLKKIMRMTGSDNWFYSKSEAMKYKVELECKLSK